MSMLSKIFAVLALVCCISVTSYHFGKADSEKHYQTIIATYKDKLAKQITKEEVITVETKYVYLDRIKLIKETDSNIQQEIITMFETVEVPQQCNESIDILVDSLNKAAETPNP